MPTIIKKHKRAARFNFPSDRPIVTCLHNKCTTEGLLLPMESWAATKKAFARMAAPPTPVRISRKWFLARLSLLSINKVDTGM